MPRRNVNVRHQEEQAAEVGRCECHRDTEDRYLVRLVHQLLRDIRSSRALYRQDQQVNEATAWKRTLLAGLGFHTDGTVLQPEHGPLLCSARRGQELQR